jgi:hypothetical protein
VRSDKSLGLRAQLLVIATHHRQMGRPRFSLKLQGLVEQVIQFFPSLRRHLSESQGLLAPPKVGSDIANVLKKIQTG